MLGILKPINRLKKKSVVFEKLWGLVNFVIKSKDLIVKRIKKEDF